MKGEKRVTSGGRPFQAPPRLQELRSQSSGGRRNAAFQRPGAHAKGLGVGEVTHTSGGKGDGCDRCGCPDEELCCPIFWNDAGVPPVWPLSAIFDPKNGLNDNRRARSFGNFGFIYFDKERKAFMGTALAATIVAIISTACVCIISSFKVDHDDWVLLSTTAWSIASSRWSNSEGGDSGRVIFMGLSRVVVTHCSDAPNDDFFSWRECTKELNTGWASVSCSSSANFFGLPCEKVDSCRVTASNNQAGAYLTCITLVFALIGCLTRIRKVADTNVQKFIGCFPDLLGCLTQFQALTLYTAECNEGMPSQSSDGHDITHSLGFGYRAFFACWVAALIRAFFHFCTPVPGGGAGCHCVDLEKKLPTFDGGGNSFRRLRSMSTTKESSGKSSSRASSLSFKSDDNGKVITIAPSKAVEMGSTPSKAWVKRVSTDNDQGVEILQSLRVASGECEEIKSSTLDDTVSQELQRRQKSVIVRNRVKTRKKMNSSESGSRNGQKISEREASRDRLSEANTASTTQGAPESRIKAPGSPISPLQPKQGARKSIVDDRKSAELRRDGDMKEGQSVQSPRGEARGTKVELV